MKMEKMIWSINLILIKNFIIICYIYIRMVRLILFRNFYIFVFRSKVFIFLKKSNIYKY